MQALDAEINLITLCYSFELIELHYYCSFIVSVCRKSWDRYIFVLPKSFAKPYRMVARIWTIFFWSHTIWMPKKSWVLRQKNGLKLCSIQSSTRILDPGNSRENQPDFFSLDHEKLFSSSRFRLETRDWKKKFLFSSRSLKLNARNSRLVSMCKKFSFSSRD